MGNWRPRVRVRVEFRVGVRIRIRVGVRVRVRVSRPSLEDHSFMFNGQLKT
jgi:hypothetical protein